VQIYRLITTKSYEQHMFHVASLKLGLVRGWVWVDWVDEWINE
jgi:hypothetical protein